MIAISVDQLDFAYEESPVLRGIEFSLEKGKFYSILGPNGSGKTTLLKNIQKIYKNNKECVYINGEDITSISVKELSKRLSVVPQETHMDFDFSVLDMVLMGRSPYLKRFETESGSDLKLAESAMKITDTWRLKDKSVRSISGGELQRAIVSRAMVQDTGIMLLDEPVSHLDIHHQIGILKTVSGFSKSKEITVVAVLHDINLAIEFSDSLMLLNKGEIKAMGPPEEVITEEMIRELYNTECMIIRNPSSGKPHVIPTELSIKGD
ncbi:ABC transporter ATP-binding protein [Proteiniclasticum sp. C24MP]|uniref:ABC transporter ATP-binding protein n=1 Tax=Proteiniclasticum sp. C24MP TaxID=3374101 RepID=UPI003754ACFF